MPGAAALHCRSVLSSRSGPPPDITDAVAVWWAGDLALADNAGVTSWVDRVAAIELTPISDNPTYQLFALNGQPAVLFDGTNDAFTTTNTVSTSTDGCVVAVLLAGETFDQQAIWSTSNTATNTYYLYGSTGLDNFRIRQRNADTADDVETATVPVDSTFYALEWSSDGAAYTIRVNNVVDSLSVVTGANNGDWFGDVTSRTNFSVGVLRGAASFDGSLMNPDTYLGYLGVFDSPLSAGDRTSLYNWIAQSYGVSF